MRVAAPTAGPWSVDLPFGEPGTYVQSNVDTSLICRVLTRDDAERVANAQLIAAAPELLAACESVLESLTRNLASEYLPETRACLAAAIAKAKG